MKIVITGAGVNISDLTLNEYATVKSALESYGNFSVTAKDLYKKLPTVTDATRGSMDKIFDEIKKEKE